MPLALLLVGVVLIISAFRGTHRQLGVIVSEEFRGPQSFLYWLAALGLVGAIGYFPAMRGFSRGFIALVFLAFVLANGGVFDRFTQAISGAGR